MDLLAFLQNALPALHPQPDMPATAATPPSPDTPLPPINVLPDGPMAGRPYPVTPTPTMAQFMAQQAPLRPEGETLYGKVMNALAPVPDATAAMMSPRDQRLAQSDAVSKLLGGLFGAYHQPGTERNLAVNVAQGLSASQQAMADALQASQSAANLQGTNAKVQEAQMKNAAVMQAARQFPPQPGETQDQYISRMAQMGMLLAPTDPAAAHSIGILINALQGGQQSAAGSYAPPEWNTAYDKAHPEPPVGTPAHAIWAQAKGQAATNAQYGGTAMRFFQISSQETREKNAAITQGQRNTSLAQGQTRIEDQETRAFTGRKDVSAVLAQAPNYSQMYAVLDQAAKGNPVAYHTTVGNLVQTLDQKGQLRQGMLSTFGELDPSFEGKLDAWFARWKLGGYPQSQLQDLTRLLNATRTKAEQWYKSQASDYQRQHPNAKLPTINFGAPATGLVGAKIY